MLADFSVLDTWASFFSWCIALTLELSATHHPTAFMYRESPQSSLQHFKAVSLTLAASMHTTAATRRTWTFTSCPATPGWLRWWLIKHSESNNTWFTFAKANTVQVLTNVSTHIAVPELQWPMGTEAKWLSVKALCRLYYCTGPTNPTIDHN